MRKKPDCLQNEQPPEIKPKTDRITQVREYQLITPLFGGGVEPNTYDPVSVVRATAIRGHLRFWWRACRGGGYKSLEDLKRAEDAIWGAAARTAQDGRQTGGQSPVWVAVTCENRGAVFTVRFKGNEPSEEVGNPKSPYSYVAFPLNESKGTVQEGVKFSLTITFLQAQAREVEAALWAWETFGGIGARTRRGFGALQLKCVTQNGQDVPLDLPPAVEHEVDKWLKKKLEHYVVAEAFPAMVPHLVRTPNMIIKPSSNALDVWAKLIKSLKNFRQVRRDGDNNASSYGHSVWPEPNMLRKRYRQQARGPFDNRVINAAPRGAFGLPIIFHMPHDSKIDTDNISLQLDEKRDRFASPLILKPLACQGGKAVGLALILEGTTVPEQLYLKGAPEGQANVTRTVTPEEARKIPPLNGNSDVLQAFLNFLKERN
ncbi:MAG: type III-B CRISPR module RAMP protein Cmr1 [Chloroflexaceae bacterium]|nr:type III-B CRISPR module RAMP protein Cmr1 [Chloroflexaceae bacterium]